MYTSTRILVVAVGVIVISAFSAQAAHSQAPPQQNHCATCEAISCAPGYYLVTPDANGTFLWSFGQFCMQGSCPSGACFASDQPSGELSAVEVARRLEDAAASDNASGIAQLVKGSRYASLNVMRHAIQVRSCQGAAIIAHIPLNGALWIAVLNQHNSDLAALESSTADAPAPER